VPDAYTWHIYYRCGLPAWQNPYPDAEIGCPCHPTIIAHQAHARPVGLWSAGVGARWTRGELPE